MRLHLALSLSLIALAGCQIYPPTATPDYTIRVANTPQGMKAIPPSCASWSADVANPYDNEPIPNYGCADARNLAMEVDQPSDLVAPRTLGPTRGVAMVGAIRRYDNNQTRGLIYVSPTLDTAVDVTTAPTGASSMSGDVTGVASQSSSSSSSSSPSSSGSSSSSSSPVSTP
jgi:hypothetical protein